MRHRYDIDRGLTFFSHFVEVHTDRTEMLEAPACPIPLSRERILQIAQTLPVDLRVLSKLTDLLKDVNSELDEIAALLRRDAMLSAKVVRISNSAMFGGGRSIASPDEAMNCVGFGEILKLVGTATAGRLSEKTLHCYDISAKLLRDNMLYGAFAAEALARPAGLDPRVAYSAGLLRSVGLMVLDRAGRANSAIPPLYTPSRWPDYVTWETAVFGIPSCEVTAILLDEWQFPVDVSAAIRAHYVTQPDDQECPLAVLLNVANGMAQLVCRSFRGEDKLWKITPEKLSAAHLTEDDFGPAIVATEKSFDAANDALGGRVELTRESPRESRQYTRIFGSD
jgi:HD-like signal output (HDOD) protein